MAIPIFRPTIRRKDMDSVLSCLVSDNIGPGKRAEDLSAAVAEYLDARGGVCVASYFTALRLAIEMYELKAGDRVVISSLSPAIYLDVLAEKSLVAVPADVDSDSGTISKGEIERLEAESPALMIAHHTLGCAWHLAEIEELAFPVIEDVSHALGGTVGAQRCGMYGDAIVVSLAAANIITAGGGGIVLARSRGIHSRLKECARAYQEHSFLPDMNAALGLAQMKELDATIGTRREIAAVYGEALMRTRHRTFVHRHDGENADYSFPVIAADSVPEVRKYALKNGVETLPAFADSAVARDGVRPVCPQASDLALRCLLFPLYPMLKKRDVESVAKVLSTLP